MAFDQSAGIGALDNLRSQQVAADSQSAIGDESDVIDLTAAFKEHAAAGDADKKAADGEINGLMKDFNAGAMSRDELQKKLDAALAKRRHAEYKANTFKGYMNSGPTGGVDAPSAQPPLGGNDQTAYV